MADYRRDPIPKHCGKTEPHGVHHGGSWTSPTICTGQKAVRKETLVIVPEGSQIVSKSDVDAWQPMLSARCHDKDHPLCPYPVSCECDCHGWARLEELRKRIDRLPESKQARAFRNQARRAENLRAFKDEQARAGEISDRPTKPTFYGASVDGENVYVKPRLRDRWKRFLEGRPW